MKDLIRRFLGDRGENTAVAFLRQKGFRILQRQHRNLFGEVDIVALDGKCVVFVEVKTRTTADQGQPFETVDLRKQQRLTRVALAWLKKTRRLEQPARFDIISIIWPDAEGTPQIQHFAHAFEPVGRGQLFS